MDARTLVFVVLGLVLVVAAIVVVLFVAQPTSEKVPTTSGVAARARVLEIMKTGISRGPNRPLVQLKLEIEDASRGSRVVEIKQGIHVMDLPRFQQGAVVDVLIDLEDPHKVVLRQ